ncbi:MAG: hypothetical protein AB7V62_17230 [Thermoleophilia bacterium]
MPARRRALLLGSVALAAGASLAVPAVVAAPPAKPVTITMGKGTPFQTSVAPKAPTAGRFAFTLRNRGSLRHEAVILRTNIRYDKLPVRNGRAVETGRRGAIRNVPGGRAGKLTIALPAGKYVIICNLPGHYVGGMRTPFTVRRA